MTSALAAAHALAIAATRAGATRTGGPFRIDAPNPGNCGP